MDFGRSVSFVNKDPSWIVKVLLGSIISIVPILNFAAYGYALDVIRNVSQGRELPLPEWGEDFGGYFVRGFLYAVITFIYLLPVILIYFVFIAFIGVAAATSSDSDAAGGAIGLLSVCLIPIIFIAAIFLGILAQVAGARYAITRDFGSAMRFGEVWNEFRSNLGTWMMVIVYTIVVQLVLSLVVGITCGIGFLVSFYGVLILSHLVGQAHRQASGGFVTEPAKF